MKILIIFRDPNLTLKLYFINHGCRISVIQQNSWILELPDKGTVLDSATSFADESNSSLLSNQLQASKKILEANMIYDHYRGKKCVIFFHLPLPLKNTFHDRWIE